MKRELALIAVLALAPQLGNPAFAGPNQSQYMDGMKTRYELSDELGSMTISSDPDATRIFVHFVAGNDVAVDLRKSSDWFSIDVGDHTLSMRRMAGGAIKVETYHDGSKATKVFSPVEVRAVEQRGDNLIALAGSNFSAMSEAELDAYSALMQFMERHDPYITLGDENGEATLISLKCGLYVTGTFAIASLAAGECAASLGLGCLAGVAGTYMAWDATVAECGL